MRKVSVFNPPELGKPHSPYSRALRVDGATSLVYVAGMASFDKDGKPVGGDDFEAQCRQVFLNIEHALKAAGADWDNVVNFTSFLKDAADIPLYAKYRQANFPAMFKQGNFPPNTLVLAARFSHESFRLEVQAVAAL
jgi:enamine deaminase RidA (YjgF/YER057c/UK114 family)